VTVAAIPANVYKIVMQGSLSSGFDIWNNVFHFQASEPLEHVVLQDLSDKALAAWEATLLGAGTNGHFGNSTTVDKASAVRLDVTNHTVDETISTPPGASPHGSGGVPMPSEVAVCVTLLTALVGRSYRGRTFLGGVAANDGGDDGKLSAGAPLVFANATLAFLQLVQSSFVADFPAVTMVPSVLSVVRGVMTPITSTRCGNVFDVQRRRRNGTPEVYTPST
jgi:hypothetical protein